MKFLYMLIIPISLLPIAINASSASSINEDERVERTIIEVESPQIDVIYSDYVDGMKFETIKIDNNVLNIEQTKLVGINLSDEAYYTHTNKQQVIDTNQKIEETIWFTPKSLQDPIFWNKADYIRNTDAVVDEHFNAMIGQYYLDSEFRMSVTYNRAYTFISYGIIAETHGLYTPTDSHVSVYVGSEFEVITI
ncbi:hypothetical protein [Spiroplasma endosymbiont of Othius punctulatus]|uniref:hypothetical protein n=1 Tax=Spiroplasma endosymbiont of Othius punctulatus TaxID=3066289 RepID=UPI0030CD93DD